MTPQFLAVEMLNGLQYGMLLLLVTVALALIFGLMDVINFAHGALYALGAYVGVALVGVTKQFWLALIVAPLLVAFLQLTRLGLTVRGVSNDPEMVAVLGVNVPLVRTFIFALGTGMAGLAGVIVGPLVSAYPAMG